MEHFKNVNMSILDSMLIIHGGFPNQHKEIYEAYTKI